MNATEIIALVGLIGTALVSIFSKVSDRQLVGAQAEKEEATAAEVLVEGWRSYASAKDADNAALRAEMKELRKEFKEENDKLRERIRALEAEVKILKNGGTTTTVTTTTQ